MHLGGLDVWRLNPKVLENEPKIHPLSLALGLIVRALLFVGWGEKVPLDSHETMEVDGFSMIFLDFNWVDF